MAASVSHHFPSIYNGHRKSWHKVNNMLNIQMLVTSLLKCLQCFSAPAEQALHLYPCFTFPWSCLRLSDLDSYHSLSHSQCPDIFKYSKPSGQGDCTSFPSRGMSHPVLLSSKHLHLLPISAEYLFFPPFRSTLQLSPFVLCPRSWSVGMASVGACPVGNFRRKEGMPSSLQAHWSLWHVPHCCS